MTKHPLINIIKINYTQVYFVLNPFERSDDLSNFRSEAETKELHRKILTAATALFIQKGYERTKITDIAKLSGVP